jgi:hypothetical protein
MEHNVCAFVHCGANKIQDDLVIIQLALSKEQIDAVIERSREIKRQAEGTVHVP